MRARPLLLVLTIAGCGGRAAVPAPAPLAAPPPAATHTGCDGARLPGPADLPRDRAAAPVGVRTVEAGDLTVEVWYPASPGSEAGVPAERYDLRAWLPAGDAAKVPDADATWLDCPCHRDLPLDERAGPLPVVVFLHGAAAFRSQSATLTAHWASRGFVVLAPDLPGIGMRAALGGEPQGFPVGVARQLVELVRAAPAGDDDPLAFVRARLAPRVALAGHSLGALLMTGAADLPEVHALVSMAGAGAPGSTQPALIVAGDHDGIAPYAGRKASAGDASATTRRFVGLRGVGHLGFSDLCAVAADRGGPLAVARAHGIAVPEMVARLSLDGCHAEDAPVAASTPRLLAATTAFLDEHLQCTDAAATWQALARDPEVELLPADR